jgi:hypothetical protein
MISKISITMFVLFISLAAAGDQWMTSGRDGAYPKVMYFTGLGTSTESKELATQAAQVAVKRQISVGVNSSVVNERSSSTLNGKDAYDVDNYQSRARMTTEGDIQGVEIVKEGKKSGVFFALAALDKENFESNLRVQIKELKLELTQRIESARSDLQAKKLGKAMVSLVASHSIIEDIKEKRTLLSSVSIVSEKENLNYSETDLDEMYSKAVSSLEMKVISGDEQAFKVGKKLENPFVFEVTANGEPIQGVNVRLYNESDKKVMEVYSDKSGIASFVLNEKAELAVGEHEYRASLYLKVKSAFRKILKTQDKNVSYQVESEPCYVNIVVKGDAQVASKVENLLSKYDILNNQNSNHTLEVEVSGTEVGRTQGVSASRSFIKTEVVASFILKDKKGTQLLSFEQKAKGVSTTLDKSIIKGLGNLKVSKHIKKLSSSVCEIK